MKIALFDAHGFDRKYFSQSNEKFGFEIKFLEVRLNAETAKLAKGADVICAFVNDHLDASTLKVLKEEGVRLVALRSAGFNHVDLLAAEDLGLPVVRVPEYSPYAVAEHAVALILSLNRKIYRAHSRVREGNFSLDGLVGFDLRRKTVGVIGTGKIGAVFCRIMRGFGCQILAYDQKQDSQLIEQSGVRYVSFETLLKEADIISLHVPLTPETRHLLDSKAFSLMKHGVMLINTGRGALVDTRALIAALKSGQMGYAGLDVYEEEEGVFFEDLSEQVIQDDVLARLLTFPNVLLTSHQAFLTAEALGNIADVTLQSIQDFRDGKPLQNQVKR